MHVNQVYIYYVQVIGGCLVLELDDLLVGVPAPDDGSVLVLHDESADGAPVGRAVPLELEGVLLELLLGVRVGEVVVEDHRGLGDDHLLLGDRLLRLRGRLLELAVERLLLLEDRLHLLQRDAVEERALAVLVNVLEAVPQRLLVGGVQLVQRHVGEDLRHGLVDLRLDLGGLLRALLGVLGELLGGDDRLERGELLLGGPVAGRELLQLLADGSLVLLGDLHLLPLGRRGRRGRLGHLGRGGGGGGDRGAVLLGRLVGGHVGGVLHLGGVVLVGPHLALLGAQRLVVDADELGDLRHLGTGVLAHLRCPVGVKEQEPGVAGALGRVRVLGLQLVDHVTVLARRALALPPALLRRQRLLHVLLGDLAPVAGRRDRVHGDAVLVAHFLSEIRRLRRRELELLRRRHRARLARAVRHSRYAPARHRRPPDQRPLRRRQQLEHLRRVQVKVPADHAEVAEANAAHFDFGSFLGFGDCFSCFVMGFLTYFSLTKNYVQFFTKYHHFTLQFTGRIEILGNFHPCFVFRRLPTSLPVRAKQSRFPPYKDAILV